MCAVSVPWDTLAHRVRWLHERLALRALALKHRKRDLEKVAVSHDFNQKAELDQFPFKFPSCGAYAQEAYDTSTGGVNVLRLSHVLRCCHVQAADGACPLMQAAFGADAGSGDFFMPGSLARAHACFTRPRLRLRCPLCTPVKQKSRG